MLLKETDVLHGHLLRVPCFFYSRTPSLFNTRKSPNRGYSQSSVLMTGFFLAVVRRGGETNEICVLFESSYFVAASRRLRRFKRLRRLRANAKAFKGEAGG